MQMPLPMLLRLLVQGREPEQGLVAELMQSRRKTRLRLQKRPQELQVNICLTFCQYFCYSIQSIFLLFVPISKSTTQQRQADALRGSKIYGFPKPYNLPSFKSKINKLDLISLTSEPFTFLSFHCYGFV